MSAFDYGPRMADGQYTRHPTLPPAERQVAMRVRPLRLVIVHTQGEKPCKRGTQLPKDVAETICVNPRFYKRLFCYHCQTYIDLAEFIWWEDSYPVDIEREKDERWMPTTKLPGYFGEATPECAIADVNRSGDSAVGKEEKGAPRSEFGCVLGLPEESDDADGGGDPAAFGVQETTIGE